MPPEVLSRQNTQASRAMDIWACGVILYAMLFNKMPFSGKDKADLIRHICKKPVSFPNSDKSPPVSKTAKKLIQKMLDKDPESRISMNDLLTHKWFSMSEEDIAEEQKESLLNT